MENPHSVFVKPQSTAKCPICDEEHPLHTLQPAAESRLTTDAYRKNLNTIETTIAESEPEIDINATDLDMESLNSSETNASRP